MGLIAQGMLNKQIAQELHISISTWNFIASRLMKNWGRKNLSAINQNLSGPTKIYSSKTP